MFLNSVSMSVRFGPYCSHHICHHLRLSTSQDLPLGHCPSPTRLISLPGDLQSTSISIKSESSSEMSLSTLSIFSSQADPVNLHEQSQVLYLFEQLFYLDRNCFIQYFHTSIDINQCHSHLNKILLWHVSITTGF